MNQNKEPEKETYSPHKPVTKKPATIIFTHRDLLYSTLRHKKHITTNQDMPNQNESKLRDMPNQIESKHHVILHQNESKCHDMPNQNEYLKLPVPYQCLICSQYGINSHQQDKGPIPKYTLCQKNHTFQQASLIK